MTPRSTANGLDNLIITTLNETTNQLITDEKWEIQNI